MAAATFPLRRCGLYTPGHEVHWIQGLRYRDPEHPPVAGRLVEVGADGIIVVEIGGEVRRFWNHEPQRFAHFAARAHHHVDLQARWGMLGLPHKSGTYCFCIADPDDHRTCPETPPQGALLELMESAGGFSISAAEVNRLGSQLL